MSINSCIEDFSNEIFYEIFDYLNGIDIYYGFSNLNNRFYQFIHNSSLSDEQFFNYSKQLSIINKHQILSLHFCSTSLDLDSFLSTYFVDSSFNRLELISLYYVVENILLLLLKTFIYVPCLLSLNIQLCDSHEDISDIYRSIFSLPTLKSVKVSAIEWIWLKTLCIASKNEQLSSIEYFNIDHPCTFNDLAILTSYTPEIYYLRFEQQPIVESNTEIILSIPFDNLTHLSMDITRFDYDIFSIFIQKIGLKLIIFNLIVRLDFVIYLVSTLWERLICEHMLQLRKFSLTFYDFN